jgi:hypothetical protein
MSAEDLYVNFVISYFNDPIHKKELQHRLGVCKLISLDTFFAALNESSDFVLQFSDYRWKHKSTILNTSTTGEREWWSTNPKLIELVNCYCVSNAPNTSHTAITEEELNNSLANLNLFDSSPSLAGKLTATRSEPIKVSRRKFNNKRREIWLNLQHLATDMIEDYSTAQQLPIEQVKQGLTGLFDKFETAGVNRNMEEQKELLERFEKWLNKLEAKTQKQELEIKQLQKEIEEYREILLNCVNC